MRETGQPWHARMEVAGGDEGTRLEPPAQRLDRGEIDVRKGNVAPWELRDDGVGRAHFDRDIVCLGVPASRLDRGRLAVDRDHRPEAQPGRSDRQHAGAATDIEQAAALELQQEREAQPGGRVRTGAEGTARIDDHGDRVGGRLLPRRPHPQRSDPERLMELAPAVLPPWFDQLRGDVAERSPDPLFARSVRVGDQRSFCLLESLRVQLEELRPRRLQVIGRDRDADPAELDPAQRNALLSLSKNPSSGR